jgi:hypothetical protein
MADELIWYGGPTAPPRGASLGLVTGVTLGVASVHSPTVQASRSATATLADRAGVDVRLIEAPPSASVTAAGRLRLE